jgi:hypothetical protein
MTNIANQTATSPRLYGRQQEIADTSSVVASRRL